MPVRTDQIMSNDSLAASLFQGHDYNRSLVGDSLVWQEQWPSMSPEPTEQTDYIGRFFDGIIDFLASVPTAVYALIGVVLAACLAYWIYRSRLFYANPEVGDGNWEEDVSEKDSESAEVSSNSKAKSSSSKKASLSSSSKRDEEYSAETLTSSSSSNKISSSCTNI